MYSQFYWYKEEYWVWEIFPVNKSTPPKKNNLQQPERMKGKWKAMIWGGGVRLHCERWLEVWNLKVEQQVWWVVKERMRVRKENCKTSAWGAWWVTVSWDEISTGDNWVLCGSRWLRGWWWGGGKTFTWWGPLEHLIEKGTGDRFRHHSPLGGSWSHGKINFILIERKIMTEFCAY